MRSTSRAGTTPSWAIRRRRAPFRSRHSTCTAATTSEAATLDSLGYIAHISGAHTTALHYFQDALVLFGELGNHAYAADTLAHLGETHRALGRRAEAEAAWRQALAPYRAQQRTRDARRVEELLSAQHASVSR